MSPVEFEVHAGRGATKKWRHSIWVAIPQPNGRGPPHESTIEKCDDLNGGKHLTPVGLSAPGATPPRPPPQPTIQRHADQFIQVRRQAEQPRHARGWENGASCHEILVSQSLVMKDRVTCSLVIIAHTVESLTRSFLLCSVSHVESGGASGAQCRLISSGQRGRHQTRTSSARTITTPGSRAATSRRSAPAATGGPAARRATLANSGALSAGSALAVPTADRPRRMTWRSSTEAAFHLIGQCIDCVCKSPVGVARQS